MDDMSERDWELQYEYEAKILASFACTIDPSLPFNEVAGLIYNHLAEHGGLDVQDAEDLGKQVRQLWYT